MPRASHLFIPPSHPGHKTASRHQMGSEPIPSSIWLAAVNCGVGLSRLRQHAPSRLVLVSLGRIPPHLTEGVLELTLYGAFVGLFSTVVYLFSTRGLISRKSLTFFIFVALVGLFVSVTAHWINGIHALYQAFIFLGGGFPAEVFYLTLSSPTSLVHYSLVVVTTVITDSLMIHRLYTVWSCDRRVIIFPLLVLASQIVSGIHILSDLSRETIFNFFVLSNAWGTSYLVSSLVISVYSTGSTSAGRRLRTLTQKVLVIMVESAVLQTTMTVGILVAFQIGLLVQAVLIALTPVIFGISVLLIHLRVGLGWTNDSNLAGSGLTENSLKLSRVSMRRGTREYDLEPGKSYRSDGQMVDRWESTQLDELRHNEFVISGLLKLKASVNVSGVNAWLSRQSSKEKVLFMALFEAHKPENMKRGLDEEVKMGEGIPENLRIDREFGYGPVRRQPHGARKLSQFEREQGMSQVGGKVVQDRESMMACPVGELRIYNKCKKERGQTGVLMARRAPASFIAGFRSAVPKRAEEY
ncbi:hypothetical protein C8J57DRAFT_1256515 [Mycena rebaudengoi]|nr:hypothetical protein C8J57DRAFT_1256515 [Mycena rebaudengoi]